MFLKLCGQPFGKCCPKEYEWKDNSYTSNPFSKIMNFLMFLVHGIRVLNFGLFPLFLPLFLIWKVLGSLKKNKNFIMFYSSYQSTLYRPDFFLIERILLTYLCLLYTVELFSIFIGELTQMYIYFHYISDMFSFFWMILFLTMVLNTFSVFFTKLVLCKSVPKYPRKALHVNDFCQVGYLL